MSNNLASTLVLIFQQPVTEELLEEVCCLTVICYPQDRENRSVISSIKILRNDIAIDDLKKQAIRLEAVVHLIKKSCNNFV